MFQLFSHQCKCRCLSSFSAQNIYQVFLRTYSKSAQWKPAKHEKTSRGENNTLGSKKRPSVVLKLVAAPKSLDSSRHNIFVSV